MVVPALQTRLAALAKKLIEKHGRSITLYKRETTDSDVTKPWRAPTTGSDDSTTVIGAFLPLSDGSNVSSMAAAFGFSTRDKDDELTKRFDQILLVAATSDTKAILGEVDSVVDSAGGTARAWKIHARQELAPGDLKILYAFGVAA